MYQATNPSTFIFLSKLKGIDIGESRSEVAYMLVVGCIKYIPRVYVSVK